MKPLQKTKIKLENEIVVTTTMTLHKLFQRENGADAIALYNFYYYHAKIQKTNSPKAVDVFCRRGLKWGKKRFQLAKNILIEEGLIQKIVRMKNGRISGWYMQINYIWKKKKAEEVESILIKKETENKRHQNKPLIETDGEKKESNASSIANSNASKIDNKIPDEKNSKVSELFEFFNSKIPYASVGNNNFYAESGQKINLDFMYANELLQKYNLRFIKSIVELYSEERKKKLEDRKFLPSLCSLEDLYKKASKLAYYFEEKGIDPLTGKRFGNDPMENEWDKKFKGKRILKEEW